MDKENLAYYDTKNKERMNAADAKILEQAKKYADGLATNYDSAGKAKTLVDALEHGAVKTNTDALKTLNGDEQTEDSVKKQIVDAFNDFSTKVSDNDVVDTFKELVDYAATHKGEAASMASDITALQGKVSELESVSFTAIPKERIDEIFAQE